MDAAPRTFAELPIDAELSVPVPFACGTYAGHRDAGFAPSARHLDLRRVTQCALSRICGVCGSSLRRPIAFIGSEREFGRNAFHFPPCHVECAEAMRAAYASIDRPVLGQDKMTAWILVTTASFEFVRANRGDEDRRPTFQPNAILSQAG
jgi:hypothetical protein